LRSGATRRAAVIKKKQAGVSNYDAPAVRRLQKFELNQFLCAAPGGD